MGNACVFPFASVANSNFAAACGRLLCSRRADMGTEYVSSMAAMQSKIFTVKIAIVPFLPIYQYAFTFKFLYIE